ncbi:helix-turn-helix transcriptional regulator [Leifsonia sp. 21MFCrub1.1]|uniref:helix-turn-helix transcriptional regulator n=1 Tax=Leifsonia sp. 21MFCrub1.1 TaxID=1798223 RepID=UPI000892A238|nr:helix-turn-helix domain-containing protein [Leifsonia sp. 21MFCrub1.1]SEB09058.1 Predicted DNA-binding transcriptional regulator AlpA [Leifsonia sp. 21MFCrub1.1]
MTGEFIRPTDVAELTGLSVAALAQLRYKGKGPRYYKPTPHSVVYKRTEVIAWLEATVQTGTAVPA